VNGTLLRFPAAALGNGRVFWDACAEQPGFPRHFGRNWDAWIDVMSDLTPNGPVLLEIVLPESDLDSDPELLRQLVVSSADVNRRAGGPVLRLAFR
jgi:Barstar (barnase inhibitor)